VCITFYYHIKAGSKNFWLTLEIELAVYSP